MPRWALGWGLARRRLRSVLDIDDVAAGHVTKQRWNPEEAWQWSREPAHAALVSRDDWEAAQNVFTAGERGSQPQRHRKHDYMLKGMVTCNDCGRKLVANTVQGTLIYQCRMKTEYPGLEHPKSLSVREDHLLPTIDNWLRQLFDPDRIDDTISSLANVETDQLDAARSSPHGESSRTATSASPPSRSPSASPTTPTPSGVSPARSNALEPNARTPNCACVASPRGRVSPKTRSARSSRASPTP